MSELATAEVALLIDEGSAWTKASLIGRARDRWRIVAHAAQPTDWGDGALRRALANRLTAGIDGRLAAGLDRLLAGAPRIACHTARRSARLALVAVSRDLSGAAARRAAESAGWEVSVATALDDGMPLAERLTRLRGERVDVWLLAGGFDGHRSPRALEAAALAAAARPAGGGPVVWAGDPALADEIEALFEEGVVTALPNPRPGPRSEAGWPLRHHLEELLRLTVEPGGALHLAPVAFRRGIGELARAGELRILGVDLGARYATRVLAGPGEPPSSRIYAAGQGGWPGSGGATRIARTIAIPGADDLLSALRARPGGVPETDDELAIAHADAAARLAAMADDEPVAGCDLVVGTGRVLAAAPSPAQAALMLLDGLRPLGVTQLAIDPANAIAPLGALPDGEIGEGMGLLAEDLLGMLGTAVVCRGGESGRPAMRVSMHRPGWPDLAPIEVRGGQLTVVPLAAGQEAELIIEPHAGVSLGSPRRSRRLAAAATGGSLGLILDARGVPMSLPRRADDRRAVLASWRQTLAREPTGGVERWA